MLRLIQTGNSLPFSYICDPNSEFQPGQIAQLNAFGNQIVCGVSDGTAPIGIIDDIKTNSFTAASVDEVVIVQVAGILNGSEYVTPTDLKTELINPNVLAKSFMSDIDVELIPRNGVIVIPVGTPLNFDLAGTGTPDAVRVVVNYTYQVPNIPGDDSTQGSGRITVWFQRLICQTDQFETNQHYPLNANLFCSESGLFTTRMPSPNHAAIAIVQAPPTSVNSSLELLFL